ncbi:hypothetical protein BOW50_10200, partial [Solemya velum gill symbiont]|uniref:hypothetical protein n=1 Tax=Solemya velum gill symbiont TaxID=2340 RepID=UPI0009CB6E30
NGTHVQSLWHSLLKNDGQMKMNGLGLIDQTFPWFTMTTLLFLQVYLFATRAVISSVLLPNVRTRRKDYCQIKNK